MINKFISLKNIGKFHNCSAKGDVELRKVNLIYAGNGFGKTTLCAVLRSVQTGDANVILERNTLGATEKPVARIKFDTGVLKFENGEWDQLFENLCIFDSIFIHENIYTGDSVEHGHKKNLYRVIVGKKGVELATKVDGCDDKIRTSSAELRGKKATVEALLPQAIGFEIFLTIQKDNEIDEKIRVKEREVQSLHAADIIQQTEALKQVSILALPDSLDRLLGKTVEGVSLDAEEKVKEHLVKHQLRDDRWINEGLNHVQDNECPYCSQNIDGNELVSAYKAYFNEAYRTLQKEIKGLSGAVDSNLSDRAILTIKQAIQNNKQMLTFWQKYIEGLDELEIEFDKLIDTPVKGLRRVAAELVEQKLKSPLEVITGGEDFNLAKIELEKAVSLLQTYNATVESMNKLIQSKKDETAGGDLLKSQNELRMLKAVKVRHKAKVVTACNAYSEALEAKQGIELEKSEAKKELEAYADTIIPKYQEHINKLLDRFNPGFRIVNASKDYRGGSPRSNYQLLINDTAIDLDGQEGQPSFKNTLSAGDKSTLALAFFIAQLELDDELASKIVVFDDPFTSQDRFRRNCTRDAIRRLANEIKQMVVFSHDPRFLKIVWDQFSSGELKTLQLTKTGKASTINEWDIEEELKTGYFKDHDDLVAFVYDGAGSSDLRSVVRKVRPVLEGWLRYRFPKQFDEHDWLGDMTKRIADADTSHALNQLAEILDDLREIKDYTKKFHHDQNSSADHEPIDQSELEGFVQRALSLMGSY
jgi:wobble nucleotide-excising tRNase